MEIKLPGTKSVSASGITHNVTTYSSSFSSFGRGVGVLFSPQLCYCRGPIPRLSVSSISDNTFFSEKAIASSDQETIVKEDYVCRINEVNGASSSLFTMNRRVLDFFNDEYDGVVVDPERLPADPNTFGLILRFSLAHWRRMQKKGIWLKLPAERAELVPIAVKEGFQYHHAEPGYLMLTYWIPDGPCMLPANATHQVGVGGFVINDNNEIVAVSWLKVIKRKFYFASQRKEDPSNQFNQTGGICLIVDKNAHEWMFSINCVLVVQEKYCSPSFARLWKLPTGFILESEEIFKGAVREVKEETGVDTEFVEVIAFRHAHNVAFEKSDLFFICLLKPLSTEIKVDDLEIQAAKWMSLTEFVEQPLIQGDCMFKKVIDICISRLRNLYCGLYPHQLVSMFDGQISSLYYNDSNTEDINCIGN